MNIRTLLLTVIFSITCILPYNIPGQSIIPPAGQDEATQVAADSVAPQAFLTVGITQAFNNTNNLINDAEAKLLSEETVTGLFNEVEILVSGINGFLGDSITRYLEVLSSRELDQITLRAQYFSDHIKTLQDRLSRISGDVESSLSELQSNMERWQLTLEKERDDATMGTRIERMERITQKIDSVSNMLQKDLEVTLEMQDRLADSNSNLDQLVARVKDQKLVLGETILKRDAPGFFKALATLGNKKLFQSHIQEIKETIKADRAIFQSDYVRSMIVATLMMMALLAFAIWFKRNHQQVISEDRSDLSKLNLIIVNSPVVSTMFIVSLMIRLLVPDLPATYLDINGLVMIVAMAILMIRIYGTIFQIWIIVLLVAVSMTMLYDLAYHPGVLLRILLMGLSFTGIWIYAWLYRKRPFAPLIRHRLVYKSMRTLISIFGVLQILAIIANLVGAFQLAEFFTLTPLQITILAIGIHLSTKIAETILYLTLSSNYFQKLNVVKEEFQVIYKKSLWIMDFALLLVFISFALRILRVKDLVIDWGRGVLTGGIEIGAVSVTLGSILIFFFVIWLSIMISRIINKILEKDVFTRVKTTKGLPGTILLLLKIVLISGGFFLAAAASGMHLTNLSIVLGAFSVGIGFGLQNIFNNMVSGLILAFERPINVGDVVQVGQLMGTVKSIGLRSSRVKSFDGAEVIVPNGNLISNEMINWTLSDSNRRMDIQVGVAYGTDPELVLDIMRGVAEEHKMVKKNPAPYSLFIGFGDSSLDFRLLAWVNIDNRLTTESELNTAINRKLAEAGIEIPFPQRDLHIRSDDTKAKPPSGGTKK